MMENTKSLDLMAHRKPIAIGLGIFILGLLVGVFSAGHRGYRFEGGRFGGENFGCPMQANQNFRGQMMRGKKAFPPQAVSGQALPIPPQVGNQ